MKANDIYKCLSDPQRLRILNLLEVGSLCVCHLQELLNASQVKVSKQLAWMKQLGLVESRREGTWMIYSLVEPMNGLLHTNLNYLRAAECTECHLLQRDLLERDQLLLKISQNSEGCPDDIYENENQQDQQGQQGQRAKCRHETGLLHPHPQ